MSGAEGEGKPSGWKKVKKPKVKGCIAWIAEQNSKGNYVDRYDEQGRSLLHLCIEENAGLPVLEGLFKRGVEVPSSVANSL